MIYDDIIPTSELRLQELSGMKDAAKSEELVQSSPVAERNSDFLWMICSRQDIKTWTNEQNDVIVHFGGFRF